MSEREIATRHYILAVIAEIVPVLDHSLQGLRTGIRESLELTVVA